MIDFRCDGCDTRLPRHVHADETRDRQTCPGCQQGHDGTVVGRLDPAHYCPACAAVWATHVAAVDALRRRVVQDFETWLRDTERTLRETLARLPDA